MRKNRISILLVAVFLLGNYCSSAEEENDQSIPSGRCNMFSDEGTATIPFELEQNHVFLRVMINDRKTLRLCLDTGMPVDGAMFFASPKVNELDLEYVGQVMAGGAGGASMELVPANLAVGVTLRLPGVEFTNQTVMVISQNPYQDRLEMDGVIGYALFGRFAVALDFDKMLITLTEPDRFTYSGSGQELPIALNYGYPFLTCTAVMPGGVKVPVQLVVDLGAGHALALDAESDKNIVLPENAVEFRLGTGLGGDVNGHIGRIQSLQLGKYTLKNVVTSFSKGPLADCAMLSSARHGNLGTDALRRFNVTFDYSNQRMILEPNSHFTDPFEFNMAGIAFKKTEKGTFTIDRVIRNSPAGESGLKAGDVIGKINGQRASHFSEEALEKLLKEEGTEVALVISRGDQQIEVNLRLRRLI